MTTILNQPDAAPILTIPQRNEFNEGQEPNMFIIPEDKPSLGGYWKKVMTLYQKINQIITGISKE